MDAAHRQEVLNIELARLLCEEGLVADPETIHYDAGQRRRMPDVLVDFRGLRMAIEGDFEDAPNAEREIVAQALERVESGVAHIGIGVLYPVGLRTAPFAKLAAVLRDTTLRWAVTTPDDTDPDFNSGLPHGLGDALRRLHEDLGQDKVLEKSVATIHAAVEEFAQSVGDQPAVASRFAASLGIIGEEGRLSKDQRLAVRRISGLVIANALIFHEVLSGTEDHVPTLQAILARQDPINALLATWRMIIEDINYYPIFHIASEVAAGISRQADVTAALKGLVTAALRILSERSALRHDLMGRIYHRLLTEAKHLGAYYTSVPAATLLLKVALEPGRWPERAWCDLEDVGSFRVADLACGTGTLLMAAADAIHDNYVHACASNGVAPDTDSLHETLLGTVLHGYDVLPSAVHLTASTLALRNPEVMVQHPELYSLPLGGDKLRLGSIEFMSGNGVQADGALFAMATEGRRAAGRADQTGPRTVQVPLLDLCVMNPPFTRSVGGNLLFGSLPETIRGRMQERLKELRDRHNLRANITAGLGAVFVAIADRFIRPGGRLALVLPEALLNGIAWGPTRDLLRERYDLEHVIVSHQPDRWNFSENTSLSEVLVVARRRSASPRSRKRVAARPATFVNLWQNPRNSVEALSIASSLARAASPNGANRNGIRVRRIRTDRTVIAETVVVPPSLASRHPLFYGAAFAQGSLVRTLYEIASGSIADPDAREARSIPMRPLGDIASSFGPDVRDIRDGFDIAPGRTAYAAFWGHNTGRVTTVAQEANAHLLPLAEPRRGRGLRDADLLWQTAGRLMLAERLRLNTARVVMARLPQAALSNSWWPISLPDHDLVHDREKALSLWVNSTLGLLLLLAARTETEGAWSKFKKPNLEAMPVLDVEALSVEQLSRLSSAFDRLARLPLGALSDMADDPVRAQIDTAIEVALDLPPLAPLRDALSWEPVVCITMDRLLSRQRPDPQNRLPL